MTDANNNSIPDEIEGAGKSPLFKLVALAAAIAAIGGVSVVTSQVDQFRDWYCQDKIAIAIGKETVDRTVRLSACEAARACLDQLTDADGTMCQTQYNAILRVGGVSE